MTLICSIWVIFSCHDIYIYQKQIRELSFLNDYTAKHYSTGMLCLCTISINNKNSHHNIYI